VDDPGEYIGLIDFDDDIEEVIPLGPFGVSLDPWNHAVEQLDGAGGTAFFDAVSHAMNVLEMQGAPGRVNIIIALTDGVDQDSLRSASDVISELQGASVPVVLFALAYGEDGASGTDYDLAVLEQLAEATDGVAYAATPEDLERLFTLLATIF
jgi:Ca-activated chloride channel family protein